MKSIECKECSRIQQRLSSDKTAQGRNTASRRSTVQHRSRKDTIKKTSKHRNPKNHSHNPDLLQGVTHAKVATTHREPKTNPTGLSPQQTSKVQIQETYRKNSTYVTIRHKQLGSEASMEVRKRRILIKVMGRDRKVRFAVLSKRSNWGERETRVSAWKAGRERSD